MMNISGVGSSITQNPTQTRSKDMEQQIKDLEWKKAKLEQELQKQNNPFAKKQSSDFDATKKEIDALEKQIQQLKASANQKTQNSAEVSESMKSILHATQTGTASQVPQFDELIRRKDQQASAGIYSVSTDENGNTQLSFDPPSEENS